MQNTYVFNDKTTYLLPPPSLNLAPLRTRLSGARAQLYIRQLLSKNGHMVLEDMAFIITTPARAQYLERNVVRKV